MSHIIAKYVGARVLNKYWKHILIAVSIIGVVVFFLLSGQVGSVIQTGTGELPQAYIKHISSFDFAEGYYVTFNVTAYDPDNDITKIDLEMTSDHATQLVKDQSNIEYNLSSWVVVWSVANPVINPFVTTVRITFSESIQFYARIIVEDAGDNAIFHKISSQSNQPSAYSNLTANGFNFPLLIITLVVLVPLIKKRREI